MAVVAVTLPTVREAGVVNAAAVATRFAVVQVESEYALYVYVVPALKLARFFVVPLTGPWHVLSGAASAL